MTLGAKRYYTTGEASEILGISPSTVIRRFDSGQLSGRRHPVTGKRLVDGRSLETFLTEHGLPTSGLPAQESRVLIVDSTESDVGPLRKALRDSNRISVQTVGEGCEVCGRVVEWRPDVVIVNTDLPDMRGRDVVRCLRHLPLPEPVRVVLTTPVGVAAPPSLLAELGVDEYYPKPWRANEIAQRIFEGLGLADQEDDGALPPGERRRWPRLPANLRAVLKVYLTEFSEEVDEGRAIVRDISEGGAFLGSINLRSGHLPARPFAIGLRVEEGWAKGFEAKCHPVRINCEGELGLGVEIDEADAEHIERLRRRAEH